jgi:hypothetical protein
MREWTQHNRQCSVTFLPSSEFKDHPLRTIRVMCDVALRALSREFEQMYSAIGRPSIAPEKLLRALLLQILYTIRSERMLMEQLNLANWPIRALPLRERGTFPTFEFRWPRRVHTSCPSHGNCHLQHLPRNTKPSHAIGAAGTLSPFVGSAIVVSHNFFPVFAS